MILLNNLALGIYNERTIDFTNVAGPVAKNNIASATFANDHVQVRENIGKLWNFPN